MRITPFIFHSDFELFANTYVISDSFSNCVIVDPGKEDEGLIEFIENNHLTLKGILLTHGHFDHIRGITFIEKYWNVFVYMHRNDISYLIDTHLNCSDRFSRHEVVVNNVKIIEVDEKHPISILEKPIQVIETPFHTLGSICFYLPNEKALISGDSLFFGSIGRTDFPGSDPRLISSSLAKLMMLDEDTHVYPGHGPETTIKNEKEQNSFVKK